MTAFVGRDRELGLLGRELARVRDAPARGAPGRCVLVRGRRRVGKSRLIEEFCSHAGLPYLFFTASRQGPDELPLLAEEVALSNLPGRDAFSDVTLQSWDAALRLLAGAVDADSPTIVVIDEFPYLVEQDSSIEATFQKQWDRLLSKKPILLLLVGSDLAMMEALNTHRRAFYQRGTELVVPPLSPRETGEIVGTHSAADAFDAYLITGGLPLICAEWPTGTTMWQYLAEALTAPTAALVVSAERTLSAEFPDEALARRVLGEIGAGERSFSNIARAAGGLQSTSLTRALDVIASKRIVARDLPLSTTSSRDARYRVTDPYLRFWLQFIGPHLPEIERGRGDRVVSRVERSWASWRGRTIEPVVREALTRLSPVPGLPPADVVGSYWTRTNTPEIDVVGADRGPVAQEIVYAGTIKWLNDAPLDQGDLHRLAADVARLPGAGPTTPLVAISRNGVTAAGAAATLGPDDLLSAW